MKAENVWIIPSNPKQYNLIDALRNNTIIEREQLNYHFQAGDIVYYYVSKPIQRILYKMIIAQTDLPQKTISDAPYEIKNKPYAGLWFRMEKLLCFNHSEITIDDIERLCGVSHIQSPIHPTEEMLAFLIDQEGKEKSFAGNNSNEKILFCNIAWMEHYDKKLFPGDRPQHGGAYVSKTGEAYEDMNFHLYDDGYYYGFVETGYSGETANQNDAKQMRIENINNLFINSEKAEGITVVFCAHSDLMNETVIVGWYNNASVFRNRRTHNDGHIYNIVSKEAVILPVSTRDFQIPRAGRAGIGFGQSNVWYANKPSAKGIIEKTYDYIKNPYEDFSDGQIFITVDQWRTLIQNHTLSDDNLAFLAKFYAAPDHTATCSDITIMEGKKRTAYNSTPKSIGLKVLKALSLPEMKWESSGQKKYFPIFFLDRVLKGSFIEWRLRPELVIAMEMECPDLLENAYNIRYQQEESYSSSLSDEEIMNRARNAANYVPSCRTVKTIQFSRDPRITLAAKRRAAGVCQLCGKPPFHYPNGEAYLEVHHITPLAEGGIDALENVAALCPNCHKKIHILKSIEDINKLKKMAIENK